MERNGKLVGTMKHWIDDAGRDGHLSQHVDSICTELGIYNNICTRSMEIGSESPRRWVRGDSEPKPIHVKVDTLKQH